MSADLAKLITDSLKKASEELGRVNLLMAGITGVGKSTLANTVFAEELARTGQGKPVTMDTQAYSKEGFPLTIFDTRGLETARYRETLGELKDLVERRKTKDLKEHIHVAWICISEDGRRVQEAEIELADMLAAAGVPVIAVITKARSDGGFRDTVRELLPRAAAVCRVRALAETMDDGHRLEPFGLEDLIETTMEAVPDGVRNAFVAAQKVSLELKVRRATLLVNTAAASAGATAAIPLPFANLWTLAPIHLGMLAGINGVFGLSFSKSFLQTVISSALGVAGTGYATRTLVSAVVKFIPGIGTVAGGVIASTTATAMTTVLGRAYIAALRINLERAAGRELDAHQVAEDFKAQFRRKARELPAPAEAGREGGDTEGPAR